MRVEFVSPYDHSPNTGIGRYVHTLTKQLSKYMDAAICRPQFAPLAGRFSVLRNLPIGIDSHVPGSIVHFPQIMGCAMMLYRSYHPSVATVHDLGFLELPEEWKMFDPVARHLLRLSLVGLKRVDMIITVSEFTRQGVIKHLNIPGERVVTVHSGIDHDLFRPIPNARQTLIDRYPDLTSIATSPWLLYVGSELPRKNITGLLKAVATARDQSPAIQLLKVGTAGGAQFREETAYMIGELGLQKHVQLFENVAEEELPLFYSAADIFVTASKLEGFGFPVLEAMACSTPVIAPDIAIFNETAHSGSLLARSGDSVEFGNAIRTILTDVSLQAELREKSLENVSRYTWPNAAERLIDVYCQLTAKSSVANPSRSNYGEKLVETWSRIRR